MVVSITLACLFLPSVCVNKVQHSDLVSVLQYLYFLFPNKKTDYHWRNRIHSTYSLTPTADTLPWSAAYGEIVSALFKLLNHKGYVQQVTWYQSSWSNIDWKSLKNTNLNIIKIFFSSFKNIKIKNLVITLIWENRIF